MRSGSGEIMAVGDHVALVDGSKTGMLRYLGTTTTKEGLWAGIEVDDEYEGKHDGMFMDERYFTCAPGRGILWPWRRSPRRVEESSNSNSSDTAYWT